MPNAFYFFDGWLGGGDLDFFVNLHRIAINYLTVSKPQSKGDTDLLGAASEDRLHQAQRLESLPDTAAAMDAAREAGAWCSWLSGSGPTAAAMCEPAIAEKVAAALPPGGEVSISHIDMRGAVCE